MGKISPISSKYIIHSSIQIEGVVDKPDVIGAVFGQTEGLLGAELELRELQRSGRIGRIEVETDTRSGKTYGSIIIPSSLDKAETSIVAAALEVIQRIGPCNANVKVSKIEDVRVSKRKFVVERAKELLKLLMDDVLPDSQEISDEVTQSVRVMELVEYGRDRLPAGPVIDESDELIIVEGRADVINMLKRGFKNAIAMNGTSCPKTLIELSKKKEILVFVDGDRGGNLIVQELANVADIDFVTRAPDGKEVEELTKKEVHKAIRAKVTVEQFMMENSNARKNNFKHYKSDVKRTHVDKPLSSAEKTKFSEMIESLIGTRAALLIDKKLNVLGKMPVSELNATLKSMDSGVYAVVFDGVVDKNMVNTSERSKVSHLVGMSSEVNPKRARLNIVTVNELF